MDLHCQPPVFINISLRCWIWLPIQSTFHTLNVNVYRCGYHYISTRIFLLTCRSATWTLLSRQILSPKIPPPTLLSRKEVPLNWPAGLWLFINFICPIKVSHINWMYACNDCRFGLGCHHTESIAWVAICLWTGQRNQQDDIVYVVCIDLILQRCA